MELDKLPPDIQAKIMGIEADSAMASAVEDLAIRENIKQENEARPIIMDMRRKRTGLPALIFGQYEDMGFITLRNLEDIKEKMEELTVLREHPVAIRARGLTKSHVEGAIQSLKETEERMYQRGRLHSPQIRIEKNVKKANHIYNLMKKITNNKE